MKLIKSINEMTMKAGSYEALSHWLPYYEKLKDTADHVGDIETYNVYKALRDNFIDYAIFLDNDIVGYCLLIKPNIFEIAYVKKEYRHKGILSMFLFFLKQNEGLSQIILGDKHSIDMVNALKRIYKRFDAYWTDGKEKIPFDPNTKNDFYGQTEPTKWKLILENDGDFSNCQKFFDSKSPSLSILYSGLLDLND